jgi:ADP-heptose:LPS heptosyltransferase
MLKRLRERIGLQIARFRFRKEKGDIIQFTRAVSTARKALVILPQSQREFFMASTVLQSLAEKLECVLVGETALLGKVNGQFRLINIEPTEIDRFFLPKRALVQKIVEEKYDLAIDLNLQFRLAPAYLCREARSNIRAGFVKDGSDTFYNFQVHVNQTDNAQFQYERMLTCLQMF